MWQHSTPSQSRDTNRGILEIRYGIVFGVDASDDSPTEIQSQPSDVSCVTRNDRPIQRGRNVSAYELVGFRSIGDTGNEWIGEGTIRESEVIRRIVKIIGPTWPHRFHLSLSERSVDRYRLNIPVRNRFALWMGTGIVLGHSTSVNVLS